MRERRHPLPRLQKAVSGNEACGSRSVGQGLLVGIVFLYSALGSHRQAVSMEG